MITVENAITRLAELVTDRRHESRRIGLQRRNQVVDIYGVEFTRQGDGENRPARFYLSISPDLIYFERFEFKIIIESFRVPLATDGITPTFLDVIPTALNVNPTSLTVESANANVTLSDETFTQTPHDHSINPNPHHHEMSPNPHTHALSPNPHTHSLVAGMTYFNVDATQFTLTIDGVDLTPYFMAQAASVPNARWLDGTGTFPIEGSLMNFDVLAAAGQMPEGQRQHVLKPGYKEVRVTGDGLFNATLVNYLKYSHVNR